MCTPKKVAAPEVSRDISAVTVLEGCQPAVTVEASVAPQNESPFRRPRPRIRDHQPAGAVTTASFVPTTNWSTATSQMGPQPAATATTVHVIPRDEPPLYQLQRRG